jgi:2-polyprenyl-3-methyl-5-hydroxy-6-metoxy-1,4-benzoquinol methylase
MSPLQTLVKHVLEFWPSHQKFLEKSKASIDEISVADDLATLVLRLTKSRLGEALVGYKWMCDMMVEEEIEFQRTGNYRNSSFAEVEKIIYRNKDLMPRYMDGLLISQALWTNHVQAFKFYKNIFLNTVSNSQRHLEIGPGHGLLLYAATQKLRGVIEAWDISASALESTYDCLRCFNKNNINIELRQVDFLKSTINISDQFDSIVLSEVLEHLEKPALAMHKIYSLLRPGGVIFVNVPVNSPSIDHIFLFRSSLEVINCIKKSGFSIDQHLFVPSGGYTLERATKCGTTISCMIIASKPILQNG